MKPLMVTALTALAVGTAGILRSEYEKNFLSIEETVICSDKIKHEKRLVFLTDLHDKEFGYQNSRLLAAIRQQQPDFILIGGDTMVAKKDQAALAVTEGLLKNLVKNYPVYYANGNHEQRLRREIKHYGDSYTRFCRLLKQYGVIYLSNTSTEIGEDLRISGLNIDERYYQDFCPPQMKREYLYQNLGPAADCRYQILLAHSPLFAGAYADWGADLTLAGHFHGGTIRVPGLGGVMTPQFQFFLPCCAGTFETGGRYLVAGRGLGTHSIKIRLNNKPQVVVIRLVPA